MKAKSLAVASFFNCAVLLDDSVQCWGIKAPPPPAGLKAKLVAAIYHGNLRADMDDLTQGTSHACAVQLDDTLTCWGDNVEGTTDVPADLGKVKDVAVASWNTCALRRTASRSAGAPRSTTAAPSASTPSRRRPAPQGHPQQAGHLLRPADGQHAWPAGATSPTSTSPSTPVGFYTP